jgi:L-amino acid N-acyltransferase YncA
MASPPLIEGNLRACLRRFAHARSFHPDAAAGRLDAAGTTGMRPYERHRFATIGIYHEQGMLDGRWVDVMVMEKILR